MKRRDLLKAIVSATGMAFVGNVQRAFAWPQLEQSALSGSIFTQKEIAFLNEVADIIIPETDTPGAKSANVGPVMAAIALDCYDTKTRDIFFSGINAIDKKSIQTFGQRFMSLNKDQRHTLLAKLNDEAFEYIQENKLKNLEMTTAHKTTFNAATPPHYFTLHKQLILFTFFSSKIGATEVLRYVAIPGRFDGDYPYKKGDRAWATS